MVLEPRRDEFNLQPMIGILSSQELRLVDDRRRRHLPAPVMPGSPAADAGVIPGDVILKIDGRDVNDSQNLRFRLATLSVGTTIVLTIMRGGNEIEIKVNLKAPLAPASTVLEGRHPFDGAEVVQLTPAVAAQYNLRETQGVAVIRVLGGRPAQNYGFRPGDVIVQVGSQPVRTQSDVRIAMYDYKPGSTVRVDFVRDGQRRSVDVKVAAPKAMPAAPAPQVRETPNMDDTPFSMPRPTIPQEGDEQGQVPRTGKPRLGVQIETLTDALRKQFKLPAEVSGVVITAVEPGSVADRQGWTAGVVLLRVGGKTITRAQDVSEALAGVKWGDQVQIATLRMQGSTQVAEDMPVTFR